MKPVGASAAGGIVLYAVTLALETISVVVRFAIVAGLSSLLLGREAAIALGAVAALYPVAYSLAALAGVPRGHLLLRLEVGGRRLTPAEQEALDAALAVPRARGVPIPRHIFAVDRDGLNAFVAGRTLYIYRDLFAHWGLPGVLAHELGHYNSLDGRLSGAIFGLTLPGGFLITYALLGVLQWVAYTVVMMLIGLVVIIFMVARINVWGMLRTVFGICVTLTRFLIIFAVGGVGTVLLSSLWRSYYVNREYDADAYAGRLGYADQLIAFFEHEVLTDIAVPWYTQPTHPPTVRRVEALRTVAACNPQLGAIPGATQARQPQRAPSAPVARLAQPATPRWLMITTVAAGVAGALLLAAALLLGDSPPRTFAPALPPAGPTPTLGIAP
jgi:Zn-dependent protease with chaperone function